MARVYPVVVFLPNENRSAMLVPTTEDEAWVVGCMPAFRMSGLLDMVGDKVIILNVWEGIGLKRA